MKFTLHDNIEDYDPETQTEMEFISAEGYSGPLTHTNFEEHCLCGERRF